MISKTGCNFDTYDTDCMSLRHLSTLRSEFLFSTSFNRIQTKIPWLGQREKPKFGRIKLPRFGGFHSLRTRVRSTTSLVLATNWIPFVTTFLLHGRSPHSHCCTGIHVTLDLTIPVLSIAATVNLDGLAAPPGIAALKHVCFE